MYAILRIVHRKDFIALFEKVWDLIEAIEKFRTRLHFINKVYNFKCISQSLGLDWSHKSHINFLTSFLHPRKPVNFEDNGLSKYLLAY